MFQILFLVAVLLGSGCYSINPGVQIQLENSGLNYAKTVGLGILAEKVKTIQIPDINGDHDLYGYKVTNIKINSLNIPDDQSSVTVVPSSGIDILAKAVTFNIGGNYEVWLGSGWAKISHSGTVTITGTVNQFSIEAVLGQKALKPTISARNCQNSMGSVNVQFHGDVFDEIIDLFSGIISNSIKGTISSVLCSQLNNLIDNTANDALARIPIDEVISTPIGDFHINYGLIEKPTMGSDFVSLGLKGECYAPGHPNIPLVPPPVAPFKTDPNTMFYITATSYLFDTVGYAFLQAGLLHQSLDKAAVNKLLPGKGDILNTTCPGSMCVGSVIPSLGQTYPNTSCVVTLNAIEAPNATINTTGAWINLNANVNLTTIKPKATELSINVFLEAEVKDIQLVQDSGGYLLKGEIKAATSHITLYNTTLSGITEAELNQLWNLALFAIVDIELDKIVQKGIQIPNIPYCGLYNVKIQTLSNTLLIGGDIKYNGGL